MYIYSAMSIDYQTHKEEARIHATGRAEKHIRLSASSHRSWTAAISWFLPSRRK